MINTKTTVNNPTHKNGEEIIALRKNTALGKSVTGNLASARAPFLKKKCIAVSNMSLAKSNSNIFNVTFFLNIGLFPKSQTIS